MQADSIVALYDFETHIEGAVEQILEANLTVANTSVEKTRGTGDIMTPRIDVALKLGGAQPHQFPYKGGIYYDSYAGQLVCSIVTERDDNSNAHGLLRAQLRAFVQYGQSKFNNPGGLKYHNLRRIQEAGTAFRANEKDNTDHSDITFALFIEIKQDAWPA